MKKIIALILTFAMLLPLNAFAAELKNEGEFKVIFDGEEVVFPDQKPFLNSGKWFYTPVRAVSEAAGYEVLWNEEEKVVTLQKGERTAKFVLGGDMYVNGETAVAGVNFPQINDRVMVSQYGIANALNCVISWDEVNRVLSFIPKEKMEKEFTFTQNSFANANVKNEAYNEFYSMAEPAFIFPGLNTGFIPQGVAYRKDKNQFYLSGYFDCKFRSSAICVVDAETGKLVGEYQLKRQNGAQHDGHMGGIAISGKNLYFENGKNIHRISLDAVDAAGPVGCLQVEEAIMLTLGQTIGNDFVEVSNGYMWIGNFWATENSKYNKLKVHPDYPFLIRGYKLDETQPDGFDQAYRTNDNEWAKYLPAVIYAVDEERIQGMTTFGDNIVTASSLSENISNLNVYNMKDTAGVIGKINFDGKEMPVVKLNLKKSEQTFPYLEEIEEVDGKIYASYESGAIKFRRKTKDTTDRIWKIDAEKLIK